MPHLPLFFLIFSILLSSPLGYADLDNDGIQDEADIDGDGITDINDNCPTVYNPMQEFSIQLLEFFGDACNPDDDMDGIPDEIEDQLDYRDSKGGDLIPLGEFGGLLFSFDTDTDGDGANDIYEINTGTDPFSPGEFETIDLTEYLPLGEITYTYKSLVNVTSGWPYIVNPPDYNRPVETKISETKPGIYIDTGYEYFGIGYSNYSIEKNGITLIGYESSLEGNPSYKKVEKLHMPFEILEGGNTIVPNCKSDCHSIMLLDRGYMDFNGKSVEYISVGSDTFSGGVNMYYIFLKGIGLYGTHFAHLVDYEIKSQVDIKAIAASLPEVSKDHNASSNGGSIHVFWFLISGLALVTRRKRPIR